MNTIILDCRTSHYRNFTRTLPDLTISSAEPLEYDSRYLEVRVRTPLTTAQFSKWIDERMTNLDVSLINTLEPV